MNNYEFNATNLIAETFDKRAVKFHVVTSQSYEQLLAIFPVDCGPNVILRFISCDQDNDVAVRIYGLISNIPKEKRTRVMEACNILNRKIRYMKFYLDEDGDINVEYDFLMQSPDESIGEMAFEVFVRMMRILDSEYGIFMKALYSDEKLDITNDRSELMRKLQELSMVIQARIDSDELFIDFDDYCKSEFDTDTSPDNNDK